MPGAVAGDAARPGQRLQLWKGILKGEPEVSPRWQYGRYANRIEAVGESIALACTGAIRGRACVEDTGKLLDELVGPYQLETARAPDFDPNVVTRLCPAARSASTGSVT